MRKIIFRGKTFDGFWVRGDLVRTNPCECHIVTADLDDYNNIVFNFEYFVDCKTVGQFTGLLDKNRRGIYEGDVLMIYGDNIVKVIFVDGCFYVENDIVYAPAYHYEKDACEVIGNIYDNPELLG